MSYKTGKFIGRIKKVKGYEKSVTVVLEGSFTEEITGKRPVFLETEGKPVPFFVSWSDYKGGNIIRLNIEGCESLENIDDLTGCRVLLEPDDKEADREKDVKDINGFRITTPDKSLEAVIREIIDNPGQMLIRAETKEGNELLIPLHEDFIISVDKKKKSIIMELPGGLAEIN